MDSKNIYKSSGIALIPYALPTVEVNIKCIIDKIHVIFEDLRKPCKDQTTRRKGSPLKF